MAVRPCGDRLIRIHWLWLYDDFDRIVVAGDGRYVTPFDRILCEATELRNHEGIFLVLDVFFRGEEHMYWLGILKMFDVDWADFTLGWEIVGPILCALEVAAFRQITLMLFPLLNCHVLVWLLLVVLWKFVHCFLLRVTLERLITGRIRDDTWF